MSTGVRAVPHQDLHGLRHPVQPVLAQHFHRSLDRCSLALVRRPFRIPSLVALATQRRASLARYSSPTLARVASYRKKDALTVVRRARQATEAPITSTDSHDSRVPAPTPTSPPEGISASVPDWSREAFAPFAWDPSRRLLRALRDYQASSGRFGVVHKIRRGLAVLRHRFWSIVCGCDIPLNSQLGGGLLLPHPNGIVIHPGAEVGPNCLIFQQVTLGEGGPIAGLPRVGGHVDIGAGAKLLGGIVVGDHARIGANAVVTRDVPPCATVAGIPARQMKATMALSQR